MKKSKAIFLMTYARSGGTILSRHLSQLENTILLSEISEFGCGAGSDGSEYTLHRQLKEWHGLDFGDLGYYELLGALSSYCYQKRINLIIRDWSYIYYSGGNPNANLLKAHEKLAEFFELENVVYHRDPIDIWLSFGKPRLDSFLKPLTGFICDSSQIKNSTKLTYEELCENPEHISEVILKLLPYPSAFTSSGVGDEKSVTGDVQLGCLSRGGHHKGIRELKRQWISRAWKKKLIQNGEFIELCALAGYSVQLDDEGNEKYYEYVFRKTKQKLCHFLQKKR